MNWPRSKNHKYYGAIMLEILRMRLSRGVRAAALAASAVVVTGLSSCSHQRDSYFALYDQGIWALVGASHWKRTESSVKVVVDIQLLDVPIAPGLLENLALNIAREPGVLTLESGESLHLPAQEGFQAVEFLPNGVIVTRQGHDPTLHRISDTKWQIVVPIDDHRLRELVQSGATIVINPAVSKRSLGAFQGVSFAWHDK